MKKTILIVTMIIALAGVAGADSGIQPTGLASWVNPLGLGDALIFGYYNVRGNVNIINIVNTSYTDGVKANVVFRSAKTGKECFDINICLGRGDIWTAYLLDGGPA
ncbi:MAG TPA: hypothetical protein VMH06_02665, partial [Thermodesulfovibrionales bacterium]|nr:hypothetical protein [Thermodesulfovibrionales bacterium]